MYIKGHLKSKERKQLTKINILSLRYRIPLAWRGLGCTLILL